MALTHLNNRYTIWVVRFNVNLAPHRVFNPLKGIEMLNSQLIKKLRDVTNNPWRTDTVSVAFEGLARMIEDDPIVETSSEEYQQKIEDQQRQITELKGLKAGTVAALEKLQSRSLADWIRISIESIVLETVENELSELRINADSVEGLDSYCEASIEELLDSVDVVSSDDINSRIHESISEINIESHISN